jgi:hypothetical protein
MSATTYMTQTDKAVADPDVDLFAGMKKKKKKQVALDVGDSPSAPSDAPDSPAPAAAEESAPSPAQRREISLEMRNQRLRRRHQWPMRELSYLGI